MKLTFLGATKEVTGSKYLIENNDTKILVDCGLFQGKEEITKRNWEKLPIDPQSIEAILLTHAHIDHTGYIPVLIKNGFKGRIYCSKATYELCTIMLIDSGSLQEEWARKINEERNDNNSSVKPLYTKLDAEKSLKFFHPIDYGTVLTFGKSLKVALVASYHIIGSAFIRISDGKKKLTFSGDLGRPNQLIMKAPPPIKQTDFLVLESTYGDRLHPKGDPIEAIGKIVNDAVAKDGVVVIPTFAVGRAQTILYCLYQLRQKNIISELPIFLDSPMAIKVTELFCKFKDEHKLPVSLCKKAFHIARYTRTVEESKKINAVRGPAIIIAGSGMAEGGRALHHFKQRISDKKNTILFVGYQGDDTLGRALLEGLKEVSLYGSTIKVKADIKQLEMLSAHADYNEILDWLDNFEQRPKKVFLTHGELMSAESLKKKIEERFAWSVVIPKYLETYDLG